MKVWRESLENNLDEGFVFIHTPFCGTCRMARTMLGIVEKLKEQDLFYDLNASLFPSFMQDYKIESVPCLLVLKKGEVKKRIYAFESVVHVTEVVDYWQSRE